MDAGCLLKLAVLNIRASLSYQSGGHLTAWSCPGNVAISLTLR